LASLVVPYNLNKVSAKMYKRMLVPLDGSPLAEQVVPYARHLADKLDMEIVFLHVCAENQSPSRFMCQSYIDHVAELAGAKKASGALVTGDPAAAIIKYADENFIDLLMLGTHGQSGFGRWTTGSTAHRIISTAKMPVLLIPAEVADKVKLSRWPQNILIPLDGSSVAEAIIPHVKLLTRGSTETNITLLKICEPPDILADYPEAIMSLPWEEHVKRATASVQHTCGLYLDEVKNHFRAGSVEISSEVILGEKDDVAGEIAAFAGAHDGDLIAMSTHGRSGLSEWPFGHVTDKLVRTLNIPLFLFKPRK
jgi:nucleotide-binding universal stress UspA family protein